MCIYDHITHIFFTTAKLVCVTDRGRLAFELFSQVTNAPVFEIVILIFLRPNQFLFLRIFLVNIFDWSQKQTVVTIFFNNKKKMLL